MSCNDIKPSNNKTPVLELSRMCCTTPLAFLPCQLRLGMRVPGGVPSMDQIELFGHLTMCKQMTDVRLNCWLPSQLGL